MMITAVRPQPRRPPAEESGYRLAAAGREAAEDERLGLLEQIFDPVSRRRRALVQPGWRVLESAAAADRWLRGWHSRSGPPARLS